MFFQQESIDFHILDVLELHQETARQLNTGRNFNALSFRYEADTIIETAKNTYKLTDNSVCYVPAGTDYSRTSIKDHVIVIHFNIYNHLAGEIEAFTPTDPEILGTLFKEALKLWQSKEPSYKYKVSAIFCQILSEIYLENKPQLPYKTLIEHAVNYINEHFMEPEVSVSEAARRSHISDTYLRRIFKQEFGITPKKYITNARIHYAASLISTGYYSLEEICELSGFHDYKYFAAEFKKLLGASPSKYIAYCEKQHPFRYDPH